MASRVMPIVVTLLVVLASSNILAATIDRYYLLYFSDPAWVNADRALSTQFPPIIQSVAQPYDGIMESIGWFVWLETSALDPGVVKFFGPTRWRRAVFCKTEFTAIPTAPHAGQQIVEINNWRYAAPGANNSCDPDGNFGFPLAPVRWTLEDRITFNAPVRRKALDGGEFDASPMVVLRAGAPWVTYLWGYRMGLVESKYDWDPAHRAKLPDDWAVFPTSDDNFKLTTLPPPWVEGIVSEHVNEEDFPNQPGGQYFYSASAADSEMLDRLPNWRRTGNSFKQGGYVSVCRFYGGANGGPNTHFYSASDTECNWLKGVSFLSYEGQTFRVNKPLPLPASAPAGTQPGCPAGSKPLYRLYNNASAPGKNYVSNHRYVTSRTTVDAAVAIGWLDEGVSMCVPE